MTVLSHCDRYGVQDRSTVSPITDGQDVQLDIFGNQIPTEALGTPCTQDEDCRAEANEHEPDCPVEQRLQDELGY